METGNKATQKIHVPVTFGEQGKPVQSFDADAYNPDGKSVLEVKAGRAVSNFQLLKDHFQACVIVDVDYLVIAVWQMYNKQKDYEIVCGFFDTLYSSGRFKTELYGI